MQAWIKKILAIVRSGVSRMFAAREDNSKADVVAVLREVNLLSALTRRQLFHIASSLHRRHYKRDEIIYYEGDPGLGLYIVEDGTVDLVSSSPPSDSSPSILGSNQVFGVASMFGDVRREETARATQQTSLLGLFSPELKSLVRRNPAVGSALLMVLAEYLAETAVNNSRDYRSLAASISAQGSSDTPAAIVTESQ
ncbi:MAG: cyclic nucleotide-binding domain-containing protein [Rhodothermales bacterium]|nr:cyclic nucleotide-binding domain-containing protein [Rhodothermales bacterium]